jgi:cob(I)alamin adenosyltransferase
MNEKSGDLNLFWMKIYTKGGDQGETSLIGGKRVPKCHERIEAYGNVDELIAFIGLLRDSLDGENHKNLLLKIQDRLMTLASLLASETDQFKSNLPGIHEEDILFLENSIDRMEKNLPELHSFLLPGGHPVISICHVARTVCRRTERHIVKLSEISESDKLIIKYLNRLSDFLFVFSRLISSELGVSENHWKPQL